MLNPLLFNVMLTDFQNPTNSWEIDLFADDIALYYTVKSKDNTEKPLVVDHKEFFWNNNDGNGASRRKEDNEQSTWVPSENDILVTLFRCNDTLFPREYSRALNN